jgi:hypothetical protein
MKAWVVRRVAPLQNQAMLVKVEVYNDGDFWCARGIGEDPSGSETNSWYGMGRRLKPACSGTRKLEDAEEDLQALGRSKEFKTK